MASINHAQQTVAGHVTEGVPTRRRHPRFHVHLEGSVRLGAGALPAKVTDISAGGAQFLCSGHGLQPGQTVDLAIDQIGYITAAIMWCTDTRFGVSFDESPMGVGVRLRAAKIA
jgi:PilZ domain-containing protein